MATIRMAALEKAVSSQSRTEAKKRKELSKAIAKEREEAIEQWYARGGEYFIEWVRDNYKTHQDKPVSWKDPYVREIFLLIGNPWIRRILIEKAAQMGFSEFMVAGTAFNAAKLKIPTGVGFESQVKQFAMVTTRFQAAFDCCESIKTLSENRRKVVKRQDSDAKSIMSVGGVFIYFFFAQIKGGSGQDYQTPSGLRSHPWCFTWGDEYSLWSPGVASIAERRMEASELPTKPIRMGSTPSFEGGVFDNEVRGARHLFQWYVVCPHCNEGQFIDPFGNLLKKVTTVNEAGVPEDHYVSRTGEPLDWYFRDKENPQETAYFGCAHCGEELHNIRKGKFRNAQDGTNRDPWLRSPGESLVGFCDRILKEQKEIEHSVALRMPKLASGRRSASSLILELLTTKKPEDTIQQLLGKPISLGMGKIPVPTIKGAIGREFPDREPDWITAGLDQSALAGHWLIVCRWWLAEHPDREEQWKEAFCQVTYWGQVDSFEAIDPILHQHGVMLLGMDWEPNYDSSVGYAIDRPPLGKGQIKYEEEKIVPQVYLFDQMALDGIKFKRTEIEKEISNPDPKKRKRYKEKAVKYQLDRTTGLDDVRDRFYRGLMALPEGMKYDPKDKGNLPYHLSVSSRKISESGSKRRFIWDEGSEPDHGFHALCFSSQALHVHFNDPGLKKGGLVFGTLKR